MNRQRLLFENKPNGLGPCKDTVLQKRKEKKMWHMVWEQNRQIIDALTAGQLEGTITVQSALHQLQAS